MPELILGAVALLVILFLLRGFVNVDPKALVRALRYYVAGLLVLAAIALAVLDRFGLALLAAGLALAAFTRGRVWLLPGPFGFFGFFSRSRRQAGNAGSTTRVRTEWLEMMLDHDSGAMHGHVLKGAYAGRELDALSEAQMIEFYVEAGRQDEETRNILAAYLDRRFGADWHEKAEKVARDSARAQTHPDAGMSRAEAFEVLGLKPGADAEAIRAAHRALMLKNHPDVGGSSDVAARINEAKDVLLGT
jgi:hypothetical protein